MGASNSTMVDEDKALQLCRERKKLIGQALNSRCLLAAAHISYIETLKITGTILSAFVEPEVPVEPSVHTSNSANGNVSPSPSHPSARIYQANQMKFGGTVSRKVEERPYVPQIVSLASVTPQSSISHSTVYQPETNVDQPETSPWDYFGIVDTADNQISFPNDSKQFLNEERTSELDGEEEKFSSRGMEDSSESDEFDEPVTPTLVRSFENINRAGDNVAASLELTPLRQASSPATPVSEVKTTAREEHDDEDNVAPKDFISSMKDIEYLFAKASESGREVPRMLEANKFHFRPIFPGNESGSLSASLLKSCFSCSEDPSQVQEEPPETSVKYLTWHRASSSSFSSSRNLIIGSNPSDEIEDLTKNLLDNLSMVSRSHASTLDRLFAWEKKLYDEVKASQTIRRQYDIKCKLLRQQESKGENQTKIDKTRTVVKDLHSRIRVAIQRINSVSKKIEELRDTELQLQLEELIEGLRKMWEAMLDCHKLQFHIISVANTSVTVNISMQSETHRQITVHLEQELRSLSSSFTKWISAQKTYIDAIDKWLLKCVSLTQKTSKRKRKIQPPSIRNFGPPIYVTCGVWLDKFHFLPTKQVEDSIKSLAAEIANFLPHQEKNTRKEHPPLQHTEDAMPGFDHIHINVAGFLGQLSKFADSSVQMFTELQKAIEDAKKSYSYAMSK